MGVQNIAISVVINTNGGLTGDTLSWQPISLTLPLSWDPPALCCCTFSILKRATLRIQWSWVFMPIIWNAVLIHGVFERPIPHPLLTFTIISAAICLYMVFFATVFPKQPGVPSIPIDAHAPATSLNFLVFGVAKMLAILITLVLLSGGVAYAVGVLPVACKGPKCI